MAVEELVDDGDEAAGSRSDGDHFSTSADPQTLMARSILPQMSGWCGL